MASVILHQPPGGWGEPSMSPFCMKLECWLRMSGIPFEVRPSDMRKAPKGKIPYVDIDGTLVGDSQLVIEHLERTRGATVDAHLTDAQRAEARIVRRMIEEAYYFVGLFTRWGDDDGWEHTRPAFARILPGPIAFFLPLIRRSVQKSLRGQGTGRHTKEEIYALGVADLDALSTRLGDQPFFFGNEPSSIDAVLYGFEESLLVFPYDSPVKQRALSLANIVAHRDRMRARFFADRPTTT